MKQRKRLGKNWRFQKKMNRALIIKAAWNNVYPYSLEKQKLKKKKNTKK